MEALFQTSPWLTNGRIMLYIMDPCLSSNVFIHNACVFRVWVRMSRYVYCRLSLIHNSLNCDFYLASEEKIDSTPTKGLSGGLCSDTGPWFHSNTCRPLNQVIWQLHHLPGKWCPSRSGCGDNKKNKWVGSMSELISLRDTTKTQQGRAF